MEHKTEDFEKQFPEIYKDVYCGFCLPAGWSDLVWKLSEDIQRELDRPENIEIKSSFKVAQIKEKFGGLRFNTDGGPKSIDKLIDVAEKESFHICETCGKPGLLRKGGWIRTLCDEHSRGREAYPVKKDGSVDWDSLLDDAE